MELCLEQLDRDIDRKEVQCSEQFMEQTFAIQRLIKEFYNNKDLMELVAKFYKSLDEHDSVYNSNSLLSRQIEDKENILNELLEEYNELDNSQMDKKIELGSKIKTLKIELSYLKQGKSNDLKNRMEEIKSVVKNLGEQISGYEKNKINISLTESDQSALSSMLNDKID